MKKQLQRGKDWHAWAWKHTGEGQLKGFFYYAEPARPSRCVGAEIYSPVKPSGKGKWVRVKFVEVKR